MATTYVVHSTVRARHNRTLRATQPTRHRFKQHIGDAQRRLIRNRPIEFKEEEFLRHLPDIKAKQASGILEVRTPGGLLIDLETLEPRVAPPVPPLPKPPLDSIARDLPWGQEIPPFGNPDPTDGRVPALLSDLDREAQEEEIAERRGEDPASSGTSELSQEEELPSDATYVAPQHPPSTQLHQPSRATDTDQEEEMPSPDTSHGTHHSPKGRKGKR